MYSKNPFTESEILTHLHHFSEETLWSYDTHWSNEEKKLFQSLEKLKVDFRFPAVKNDVGQNLNFLVSVLKPKTIFEMGSGYGQSAFWYLVGQEQLPQSIYLTERRDDLIEPFSKLSWPEDWKEVLHYHQGDALLKLAEVELLDLVLLDGEKGQYLEFLKAVEKKLSARGVVVVDNAFVKGTFLKEENQHKDMVKKTHEFHAYLKKGPFKTTFLPVRDGLFLLSKA
ncbi:MAG: O-methyltransferase [Bacteriovoracaceae bacterium]